MKRNLYKVIALVVCILMMSGCGAGKNADENIQEASPNTADAPKETQEASLAEETQDMKVDSEDDAVSAYAGILDMFYYKILGGWD